METIKVSSVLPVINLFFFLVDCFDGEVEVRIVSYALLEYRLKTCVLIGFETRQNQFGWWGK